MDAVSLQLAIKIQKPKGVKITRAFLDEVVREWADSGETPSGIDIRIIDWKRNDRAPVKVSQSEQETARHNFKEVLRQGRFTVQLRSN